MVYIHKAGLTPEQIRIGYPDLNLAQTQAALSYYANTEEVEAELADDKGWEEDHERCKAEYLAKRATR